jgi:hypothetical protein
MHVVLLGDSIFDNKSYTGGAPDVAENLLRELHDSTLTLLARDGAVMSDVHDQLKRLPNDATHLVLSIGGNNLLGRMGVLNERVSNAMEAFGMAASLAAAFTSDYAATVDTLRARRLPLLLCTIYNPHFPEPSMQPVINTALSLFIDCILREAACSGNPVIDLRRVVTEPGDFEFNIEPSGQGGAKIGKAIAAVLVEHDFNAKRTVLYP